MTYYVFYFKQKMAYEMRISDWSSDVCSSDLAGERTGCRRRPARGFGTASGRFSFARTHARENKGGSPHDVCGPSRELRSCTRARVGLRSTRIRLRCGGWWPRSRRWARAGIRSEEHTSELQSLMRISYAVVC